MLVVHPKPNHLATAELVRDQAERARSGPVWCVELKVYQPDVAEW
jgi:hypothetical protein